MFYLMIQPHICTVLGIIWIKGTRQDQTADESKQTKTYNFWQNTQKTEKETLFCTINLNVWAKTFFSTSYFVFSLSIYAHSKSMALFWL